MTPRIIVAILAWGLLATLLACGLEDPTFESTTGAIYVVSEPDSALITLDGTCTGRVTPDSLTMLPPGEHVVRLEKADYGVDSLSVMVDADATTSAQFTLTATIGNLEVTSAPDGAAIFLDETDTGATTPAVLSRLPVGEHVVRVALADWSAYPDSLVVAIEPGDTTTADFTLTETIGGLEVTSTPAGATIFFDGTDTGETTPAVLTRLPVGEHVVRVILAGWSSDPDSLDVTIEPGGIATADFTFTEIPGSLAVNSTPSGAAIFIDGGDTGEVTPATIDGLSVGEHTVSVVREGWTVDPASRTITILADGIATADFTLTQITGDLTVTSTPVGAAVHLDGADTGEVTPATIEGIPIGDHIVTVVRDGWTVDPTSRTVTIVADATATADFALTEILGRLSVTSTPPGAAIHLDGGDTGETTPATIDDLSPGDYEVSVELDGYTADPISATITVVADETATVDFALTPDTPPAAKTVLLEGFSNVCCPGCPEMNAALHEFLSQENYGPDRVLLIKYAVNYPSPSDPHYLANPEDNDARAWGPNYDQTGYYAELFISVPTLFGDGTLLGGSGNPPTAAELGPLVDALLEIDPGFGIQVAATVAGTSVSATITLSAAAEVDLTGMTLNAVLVESPIVYAEPPCDEGEELEFHWVMRDFEIVTTSLDSPDAGSPVVETATLTRDPSWPAENLYVIAFVQNDATRQVLQAGSDIPAAAAVHSVSPTVTAPPRPLNQPEAH